MRATVIGLLVGLLPWTAVFGEPLSTGQWLVDLGRDYPLSPQAGLSDADAELTLLFMKAASRIEPQLPEPYLWQYDMLEALGRDRQAQEALAAYVKREPSNIAAHLNWLAIMVEMRQTIEERIAFCKQQLATSGLPPAVKSDLHRRLATFYRRTGLFDEARRQARRAVEASPLNFAARMLLVDMRGEDETPAELIQRYVDMVAASPADEALSWRLANELVAAGLAEASLRLYRHAVRLQELFGESNVDVQLQGDLAVALALAGETKEAETLAQQIFDRDENSVQGYLVSGFLADKKNNPQAATQALEAARRGVNLQNSDLNQGLMVALEAVEAAATQPADATTVWKRLLTASIVSQLEGSLPSDQRDQARAAAEQLPDAVLNYPFEPEKYLDLTWRIEPPTPGPTDPWRIDIELTNVGAFPVTLGSGLMITPDFLMAIMTEGDRVRQSGPTLRTSLNRTLVLEPKQSIQVESSILVGRIRSGMIGTPQMTHQVTVQGVLSPVVLEDDSGGLVYGPTIGGLVADPLEFTRKGITATREKVRALISKSRNGPVSQRIEAVELLAMLLAEKQHISAGRLTYAPRRVDPNLVQSATLAAVSDRDWQVRARLAEALRWFVLDAEAWKTLGQLLSDEHWLVRGLTMRTLADQDHAKFTRAEPVLTNSAKADPDPWVRSICQALLERHATATATAPAE